MAKVRVAIAGVGNCASALLQGVYLYKDRKVDEVNEVIGLTQYSLGGISPDDIEFVAAFDIDERKVGKDLSQAIFEEPNNTIKVCDVPNLGVKVMKGPVMDGLGKYLKGVIKVSPNEPVDVVKEIKDSGAEVLINYLPVGSTRATNFYAEASLKAGAAFINAIPVFIASNKDWQARFTEAGLPVAGDDVMSQLGATVLHKTLIKLCVDRGVKVDETYQLNIGGDTDFLNMLEEARLMDKRESKTSAVRAMSPYPIPTRIGPSDYVEFLNNEKVCYIWIKGRYFGGAPLTIEVKLHVIDAYNSAGIVIDAIRGVKIALMRGVAGPLISVSAYCFKHPPIQMPYEEAKRAFLEFVEGKRER
ncbi:MAG: inositol-3-phosphate synthase [Nitrososphaerota archaeon]|nr:inositol-3-phosphate synthase [Nitrososphaerales archaeon]MCX8191590.1 inositol-3-phosphate synthase [Nitrososphaerales archaeon]MDW8044968.1 inositol-3-phosphate synthase [Nitrososphaerota archaeon]